MAERMTGEREARLAEVLCSHEAAVGPVTGMWKCACGEQSSATNKAAGGNGDLYQPDERREHYRLHVAQAIAADERDVAAAAVERWCQDVDEHPAHQYTGICGGTVYPSRDLARADRLTATGDQP